MDVPAGLGATAGAHFYRCTICRRRLRCRPTRPLSLSCRLRVMRRRRLLKRHTARALPQWKRCLPAHAAAAAAEHHRRLPKRFQLPRCRRRKCGAAAAVRHWLDGPWRRALPPVPLSRRRNPAAACRCAASQTAPRKKILRKGMAFNCSAKRRLCGGEIAQLLVDTPLH